MNDKNKLKSDVFRYISLHSFVRDVFAGYDSLKFSPTVFLKAFSNYVESENEALDQFGKNGLFSMIKGTSESRIEKYLKSMKTASENKNMSEVKQSMFNFLNEISKNNVSGKTMMNSFVILNACLGIEVDCSQIRTRDFKAGNKEEQERLSKGVINLSMKDFKNSGVRDELDMDSAIIMVEESLKNTRKEKDRSDELILSMNKKNKGKKFF